MKDLGMLAGDIGSVATSLNDGGEVVGTSADAAGNIRPFHWQTGVGMEDLNLLVAPDAPLQLLFATAIDATGAIAGFGVVKDSGDVHGFLAVPVRNRERGR
jgi:probable HAF family extracellular repeat protein